MPKYCLLLPEWESPVLTEAPSAGMNSATSNNTFSSMVLIQGVWPFIVLLDVTLSEKE